MSFSNTKRPSQALSQLYPTNHCSAGQHSHLSNGPAAARISRELALIGCLGTNKTALLPAFTDQSIAPGCPWPLKYVQSLSCRDSEFQDRSPVVWDCGWALGRLLLPAESKISNPLCLLRGDKRKRKGLSMRCREMEIILRCSLHLL